MSPKLIDKITKIVDYEMGLHPSQDSKWIKVAYDMFAFHCTCFEEDHIVVYSHKQKRLIDLTVEDGFPYRYNMVLAKEIRDKIEPIVYNAFCLTPPEGVDWVCVADGVYILYAMDEYEQYIVTYLSDTKELFYHVLERLDDNYAYVP